MATRKKRSKRAKQRNKRPFLTVTPAEAEQFQLSKDETGEWVTSDGRWVLGLGNKLLATTATLPDEARAQGIATPAQMLLRVLFHIADTLEKYDKAMPRAVAAASAKETTKAENLFEQCNIVRPPIAGLLWGIDPFNGGPHRNAISIQGMPKP